MKFELKRVKGYNTPSKYVFMVDGEPVVLANSADRVSLFMQYISGYEVAADINDKMVLRILTPYREKYLMLKEEEK